MEKKEKAKLKIDIKDASIEVSRIHSNPINPDYLDLDVGQYFTMSAHVDFNMPIGIYQKAIDSIEKNIKSFSAESKIDYLQKLKIEIIEAGRVFRLDSVMMDHSPDIYIIDKIIDFIDSLIAKVKPKASSDLGALFSAYFHDEGDYKAVIKILETKGCIEKEKNHYKWIGISGKKGEVAEFISALIEKEYLKTKVRKIIATSCIKFFKTDVTLGTARKKPSNKDENEFLVILPDRKNLT